MGFFTGLSDAFGFSEGGAGDAANQIQAALAAAGKIQKEGFASSEAQFDPFRQAGLGGLEGLVQGSTAGGLDQRLGEIFGSENFQNLVGERERAVRGQLSAGGLTRSGTAVQDIANVPTELGFGIENQLFGRQQGLAGQGFNAITNIENLRSGLTSQLAGNREAVGRADAGAILGGRANQAAGVQNLFGTVSGISGGGGLSNILRGLF